MNTSGMGGDIGSGSFGSTRADGSEGAGGGANDPIGSGTAQGDASSDAPTTGEALAGAPTSADRLTAEPSFLDRLTSPIDTLSAIGGGVGDVNERYSLTERGMGLLTTVGGVGEMALGTAGIIAPEPLTTAGGVVLAAHGADTTLAGLKQVWTGEFQQTGTEQLAAAGARTLGADDGTADNIGMAVDIGVSMINPFNGARHGAQGIVEGGARETIERAAPEAAERALPDVAADATTEVVEEVVPDLAASVSSRIDDFSAQGHAPQRHGGDVSEPKLDARAEHGIDPASGTTTDAFTGNTHKAPRNATSFTSDEALVQAEGAIRGSDEFAASIPTNPVEGDFVKVERPLEDVFGADYLEQVRGRTRVGSVNNPQGTVATDLTGGSVRAVYEYKGGDWNLVTMFPQTAP